jgi:hypothetical protein
MALNWNISDQQGVTPGTLQSSGLYNQPAIGANPAKGLSGADGRSYVGQVQGDELVENRLGNLLAKDSNYIQNARSRGLQGASRRGMLNSSIAQGAAERSAIEAGMPIASADAQTYLQTRMQNQSDLNQNLMQERDITNRMLESERNRQIAGDASNAAAADAALRRQLELQMQRERLAFEGEQGGLTRQQQEMMSRLGFDQDIGRMGIGYQQDLGRMGADYNFRDNLANNDAFRQDWLTNNQFNRDFYGSMALNMQQAQIQNSSQFYRQMGEALFSNPEVFGNPDFLSGINNFFQTNIFDNYFDRFLGGGFGG